MNLDKYFEERRNRMERDFKKAHWRWWFGTIAYCSLISLMIYAGFYFSLELLSKNCPDGVANCLGKASAEIERDFKAGRNGK